mgnify:CR=1 FL=1
MNGFILPHSTSYVQIVDITSEDTVRNSHFILMKGLFFIMKTIQLKFDENLLGLSGHKFGLMTYNQQIANHIDTYDMVTLEFPPQVVVVTTSFVRGLLYHEYEMLGFNTMFRKFKIVSPHPHFEDSFWNSYDEY